MNCEFLGEFGMEIIVNLIEQYKFDVLFFIGGFEVFYVVFQLCKVRDQYLFLCIFMILFFVIIFNNVLGIEYLFGLDICLNELVEYCDKIKQFVLVIWRCVFVIEM